MTRPAPPQDVEATEAIVERLLRKRKLGSFYLNDVRALAARLAETEAQRDESDAELLDVHNRAETAEYQVAKLEAALRYAPTPEFVQDDYRHVRMSADSPYVYRVWYDGERCAALDSAASQPAQPLPPDGGSMADKVEHDHGIGRYAPPQGDERE